MLESLLVPIAVHAGKTVFDHLWKAVTNGKPAAINTSGDFAYTNTRTSDINIQKSFTVSSNQDYGLV